MRAIRVATVTVCALGLMFAVAPAANSATVTCGSFLPTNNGTLGFAASGVGGTCTTGTAESGGAPSPAPAGVTLLEQLAGTNGSHVGGPLTGALTVTIDNAGATTTTGFWEGSFHINAPGYTNFVFALSDGNKDPRWAYFTLMATDGMWSIVNVNGPGTVNSFNTVSNFELYGTAASAVPLPGALPLFASGLGLLSYLSIRRKRKALATA